MEFFPNFFLASYFGGILLKAIYRSVLDPDCSILHTSPPEGKVDWVADWGGFIKWMEGGS